MRPIDADAAIETFRGLTELAVGEGAALVKALIFAGLKSRSITPTVGDWISVKERMPEDGQLVVVRHKVEGRIYSEVANYIMNLWWPDGNSNGLELNAISWIPLPEPSEEVQE